MKRQNTAARRYLREVRRGLPCSRKRKRAFLETVGRDIEEYLRETPEADYQALVRRFGSPIQIAEDYLEETDTLEPIRGLRLRRRIYSAVFAAAVLAVTVFGSYCIDAFISHTQAVNGYIVIEAVEELQVHEVPVTSVTEESVD